MKNLFFLLPVIFLSAQQWASAERPRCAIPKDTLPDPHRPAGVANPKNPIEHVIVIMQENHSFDNYFGRLNSPRFYGQGIDGVTAAMSNPTEKGKPVSAYHEKSLCVSDPEHDWDAIHQECRAL